MERTCIKWHFGGNSPILPVSRIHGSCQDVAYIPPATAILRGLGGHCPNCGKGKLYRSFLKVAEACNDCSEELNHHRADDLPTYLTVAILGHVLVAVVVWIELTFDNVSYWLYGAVGIPATFILTLLLLHVIKGGVVAWEWSMGMQGFQAAKLRRDAHKPQNL